MWLGLILSVVVGCSCIPKPQTVQVISSKNDVVTVQTTEGHSLQYYGNTKAENVVVISGGYYVF